MLKIFLTLQYLVGLVLGFEKLFDKELFLANRDKKYLRNFSKVIRGINLNDEISTCFQLAVDSVLHHECFNKFDLVDVALRLRILETHDFDFNSMGEMVILHFRTLQKYQAMLLSDSDSAMFLYDTIFSFLLLKEKSCNTNQIHHSAAIKALMLVIEKKLVSSVDHYFNDVINFHHRDIFENSHGIIGGISFNEQKTKDIVVPPEVKNLNSKVQFKYAYALLATKQFNHVKSLSILVDKKFDDITKLEVFDKDPLVNSRRRLQVIEAIYKQCFELDHIKTRFTLNLVHGMFQYVLYSLYLIPRSPQWYLVHFTTFSLWQRFNFEVDVFIQNIHDQITLVHSCPFSGYYDSDGNVHDQPIDESRRLFVDRINFYKVPAKSGGILTGYSRVNLDYSVLVNLYISSPIFPLGEEIRKLMEFLRMRPKPFVIQIEVNKFLFR